MEERNRSRGRGKGVLPTGNNFPVSNTKVGNAWELRAQEQEEKIESRRKFEEACAKIQENSQRALLENNQINSSDEEEDDSLGQTNPTIVEKILNSYSSVNGESEDLGRTQNFLTEAVKTGANTCLICISTVKRTEAIWSCEGCYCLFHLPCIQKWSKDSIYRQNLSEDVPSTKKEKPQWCCPKCRREYQQEKWPKVYTCFCGKVKDPVFDPWILPHSCGQTCERKLKPECGHKCLLLCHPGPCPPCPKTVMVKCFCGNEEPQTKRCSNREWACGNLCGKNVSCGQHTCELQCHAGKCPPCPRHSVQLCCCGKEKKKRPCSQPEWQCKNMCMMELSCGHHKCERVCHSGPCGKCPREGPRACPCGKTTLQLPCCEDVPTCGDTCDKKLACRIHKCASRCHKDECGTCLQMRTKRCKCGARSKELPCHKEFFCESRCKRIRDCSKHPCGKKCCTGRCPPCEQPCRATLNCKNHKCNSVCHPGPCFPCTATTTVKCFCGGTSVTVPCGKRVTLKCKLPCKISPDCHHKERDFHVCHGQSGCPTCEQVCGKMLKCGHSCPAKCHSAVLTKVEIEQKRAGPWEPVQAPRYELVDQPCPPCQVPVPVTCVGEHETQNVPCCSATRTACYRECGRALKCTNHKCSLPCHTVKDAPDDIQAGATCEECERQCKCPRVQGCVHKCQAACHAGPCAECNVTSKMTCHCKLSAVYVKCNEMRAADEMKKEELLCCQNQCPKEMSCHHRCPKLCHSGSCSLAETCKRKMTFKCKCKRLKREFVCGLIQRNTPVVECDEMCREIQEKHAKAKLDVVEKQKHEERRRHQVEKEVKHKMKVDDGMKKPSKKIKGGETLAQKWQRRKWHVFICLLIAIAFNLIIWILV